MLHGVGSSASGKPCLGCLVLVSMLTIRPLLLMLKAGLRVFNARLKGQEQLDCKDLLHTLQFSRVPDSCKSGTTLLASCLFRLDDGFADYRLFRLPTA